MKRFSTRSFPEIKFTTFLMIDPVEFVQRTIVICLRQLGASLGGYIRSGVDDRSATAAVDREPGVNALVQIVIEE